VVAIEEAAGMILEVDRVTKRFNGVDAVKGVSFAVPEGTIFGLMGANGAGKTTIFSMIAGHERPTSGEIRFQGRPIQGLRPWRISRLGIARTFQIVRPFPALTGRENVALAALYGAGRETSPAQARRTADKILDEVGLAALADKEARHLTLASRKRLEIARALGARPKLLLLDEVLAGLTPTEVEAAVELLLQVQRQYQLTIIMVEHVLRALMNLCTQIVVLHHGEKIAEGTPQAVSADPLVVEAYFGGAR
jgi:branched-chain amino acid transport system ATP-binding protein